MRDYEEYNGVCPVCGYPQNPGKKERKRFPQSLPPETILGGRYILGRVLSASNFSFVYIAWDALLEKRVAVKEYFPSGLSVERKGKELSFPLEAKQEVFEKGRDCFAKEGMLLGENQDIPQIVEIYRIIEENQTAYQVMEYLEGCTLRDCLDERSPYVTLSFPEIARGLSAALEALQRRSLCHYGLSPDHIYLQEDGHIRLLSFSGAKREFVRLQPGCAGQLFDECYTAPEVLLGRNLCEKADFYSLGTILFSVLTGKAPKASLKRRKRPGRLKVSGPFGEALNSLAQAMPGKRLDDLRKFRETLAEEDEDSHSGQE